MNYNLRYYNLHNEDLMKGRIGKNLSWGEVSTKHKILYIFP